MVSIKKNKKRSKQRTNLTNNIYYISKGGDITQKICKGRKKDECDDGTGNCKYIDGSKRKYCKRVSKCKKSCGAPCQKIDYDNKVYCIPPDKYGNQQNFEDVKDILSELVIEGSTEQGEKIIENTSNDLKLKEKQQNDNIDNDNDNNKDKIRDIFK